MKSSNNQRIKSPKSSITEISESDFSIDDEIQKELKDSIQKYFLKIQNLEKKIFNLESKNQDLNHKLRLAIRRVSEIQVDLSQTSDGFEKLRKFFGSRTWKLANLIRRGANKNNQDLIALANSLENDLSRSSRDIQSIFLETSREISTNIPLTVPNRRLKPNQRGFIQISPIPWNAELFQRPQQMCIAAANLGIPTTYITIFNDPGQPDQEITGHFLADPTIYIGTGNDLIAELNNNIISFYSTDLFPFPSIQALRAAGNIIVYEYIDAIDSKISEHPELLEMRHKYLVDPSTVDFVVTSARALESEMLERFPRSRVIYLPNAVNAIDFETASEESLLATNLIDWISHRDKKRKVVGYVGAIAQWLDFQLIEAIAQQNQDIDFVFFGPIYDSATKNRVPKLPNIKFLGMIPYSQVPIALKQFDVCWIPFEEGEISRTTSPLKLFEYFAAGKPILTPSAMLECKQFSEVFTYNSPDSFKQSFALAFQKSKSDEFIEKLRSIARNNTWTSRVNTLFEHVSDALLQ
jgi:teichuronic acid biosynthesis glycosyltransferase TuaH